MTDQVSGSSLPQARDLGRQPQEQTEQPSRRHNHIHHYRNVRSSHQHNHQHLHDIRSHSNRRVDGRDTSDDALQDTSDVVVIVETVSVLQVTDRTGATIIRTLPHDYSTAPVVTASPTESTVAGTTDQPSPTDLADLPDTTSTSSSASDDGNGAADSSSSSASSVVEEPTVTYSVSSMPTSFPTLSYAPIPSTPLSAAPVFPSLNGLSNSTVLSSSSSNFTASFQSFTVESASVESSITESDDSFTIFGGASSTASETSHSSQSLSTKSTSRTSTTTSTSEPSSSVTYSTSSAKPEFTPANGGDGFGSPTITVSGGDSTVLPSATDVSSESNNVSAATIAGSVVGAVSGLAIILLLAAAVLRWKKRQSSMKLIQGSGNDQGYGATMTGGSGGSGGSGGPTGGGGGMSQQRRSIPFAIPAALANLSGQSRFSRSTVSSDGGERGFTKISGRKLPPVLQFGGDGYTDPRSTIMSDQSIDYRASQNFFGEAPLSRLALGAPMLQETSTPVFHASPARTAVETTSPFNDPFSDDHVLESPTLPPDPLGRSQPSYDRSTRSHGSFSRFTEDI